MERVRFGYVGGKIANLLGEEILKYRGYIEDLAQQHPEIKVRADYGDNKIYYGVLNISLEGELSQLELVMNEIFNEFGAPQVVNTPNSLTDKILSFLPPRITERTTKPAYSTIKTLLKERGIKLAKLIDGTAVRKEHAPSF